MSLPPGKALMRDVVARLDLNQLRRFGFVVGCVMQYKFEDWVCRVPRSYVEDLFS